MSLTHCPTCKKELFPCPWVEASVCINPHCDDATEHPRVSPTLDPEKPAACLTAPAAGGQESGTNFLPVEVPESDLLWQYLSKGYSLNFVRHSLASGDPISVRDAEVIRRRVHEAWARIRLEVGS